MYHWSKVSLRVVSQLQRHSYENDNDNEDIVSCEWTKGLFVRSSDTFIINRVEDKYEALDGLKQGGITYLKIALDDMFNMSDVVITSIQEFFKKFARDGLSKYPSENLALLVQQINDVAEQAAEVPSLPRDTTFLVLTGFKKCSITKFVGPSKLMLNTERFIQLENDGDMHDNTK